MATGKITQIIGAVIDVQFPRESVPGVYEALKLTEEDRRAFIYAFLKGVIVAVERECEQLPVAMPPGD